MLIEDHRLRYRDKRRSNQEVTKVSIIGYTNAGKSTLFNKLTNAGTLRRTNCLRHWIRLTKWFYRQDFSV